MPGRSLQREIECSLAGTVPSEIDQRIIGMVAELRRDEAVPANAVGEPDLASRCPPPAGVARRTPPVAISPQAPDRSMALAEKLELGFDVLSDLDQSVARDHRIRVALGQGLRQVYEQFLPLPDQNADGSWDLPVPPTT